jgi:hypothetical protein
MRITLRTSLLEQRIEHCGGRTAVAKKAGIDRTTLWRWLKSDKLPDRPEQLVALAIALDLDVCALFNVYPEMFLQLCNRVNSVIRDGGWTDFFPAAACVRQFFIPSSEWPPKSVAEWYHRPWQTATYTHRPEGGSHYYVSFTITAPDVGKPTAQFWHIAFRSLRGMLTWWLPYGFICRFNDQVELYNYGMGHAEVAPRSGGGDRFVAQTWVGESPAEFCVASLHPFTLTASREPPVGLPTVRFEYR